MTLVSLLLSLFGGQEDESPVDGPDAIARARLELTDDGVPSYAVLGEPMLVDRSGEFTSHYEAVIPTYIPGNTEDPANLAFDVECDALTEFCGVMDVTVDTIADVDGETVPVEWENSTPHVRWRDA